ncbi:MAG: Hsp20/alpha crystallin family protein [Nitrospirales bacterium]
MELKNLLTPWNWFKKEEEQQVVRPQISGRNSGSSHPLMRLHNEIDQIFDQFYHGFPLFPLRWPQERSKGGVVFPQLNIVENKNAYTITVDVPGVEEKDIELTVQEGTLTIRGEKQTEKEDQDNQYHRVERSYGSFQRVLSLPADAEEDKIEAKFKNGVLTITVTKNTKMTSSGRKIAIT